MASNSFKGVVVFFVRGLSRDSQALFPEDQVILNGGLLRASGS
jgi:hypothetical protein